MCQQGAIIGDVFTEGNGVNRQPGWACGLVASTVTWDQLPRMCQGGYVGGINTRMIPLQPRATNENALCHANERFDSSINF